MTNGSTLAPPTEREKLRKGLDACSSPSLAYIAEANERAVIDNYDTGTEYDRTPERMAAVAQLARELLAARAANPARRLYLVGGGSSGWIPRTANAVAWGMSRRMAR